MSTHIARLIASAGGALARIGLARSILTAIRGRHLEALEYDALRLDLVAEERIAAAEAAAQAAQAEADQLREEYAERKRELQAQIRTLRWHLNYPQAQQEFAADVARRTSLQIKAEVLR
ncbi:hypothetical protein GPA19_08135 [Azoarcus indigens]|uniref:Uncharacterized protein n=1 Tax=Azoarcus indigens TaxID=29545 RepID=A0A4R6DYL7_9RHOO|nr:hypothetical protein [Azoarcus indigens]NMG64913.1 hypothetical protein [Azoarcus indigens]TDN50450.1 hypothetical protein C7389_109144 [Azoarcus indigens]